jgi:hypothetical protein
VRVQSVRHPRQVGHSGSHPPPQATRNCRGGLRRVGALRLRPLETRTAATAPVASAMPSPSRPPAALSAATPAASTSTQARGYTFNFPTQDVTIFDQATRQVVEAKPFGSSVTWLSNEQYFLDGRNIWTFDFPQNQVRAIAIDPRTETVAGTIPTGGKGTVHSLSSRWIVERRGSTWLARITWRCSISARGRWSRK